MHRPFELKGHDCIRGEPGDDQLEVPLNSYTPAKTKRIADSRKTRPGSGLGTTTESADSASTPAAATSSRPSAPLRLPGAELRWIRPMASQVVERTPSVAPAAPSRAR
jgi:hypothetical protein